MKLLQHIRSKSKAHENAKAHQYPFPTATGHAHGPDHFSTLPPNVLKRIFANVCPHALDNSYNSSEESMVNEDGCVLCELKDLAQCALVSKRWNAVVQDLLYQNVRIEPVHYCEREFELAKKRKRGSFFDRNADPPDAPKERLLLFMHTVRDHSRLASKVQTLRLPYMTREACKPELARTVAVLPNLRYVDLPEGFYSDDMSCKPLKQELLASCPQIRRMKFNPGSEDSFVAIPLHGSWQMLSILELHGLQVESDDLLSVLFSFPALQDLKLVDMPWLDNNIFAVSSSAMLLFPPVPRLTLQNTPLIHTDGIVSYLSHNHIRESLRHLSLSATGIPLQDLHHILSRTPHLQSLTVIENVEQSLPNDPQTPPLASGSLTYLHYEIISRTTSPRSHRLSVYPVTASYYTYLISSLVSKPPLLPALATLYVREPNFPEALLKASTSPKRPFVTTSGARVVPSFGFMQPINIFTKGSNELEWNFASVHHRRSGSDELEPPRSSARPVSMMGAESLSSSWAAGGRRSMVVGNGQGGFLAVPTDDDAASSKPSRSRPMSMDSNASTAWTKGERKDLWR